MGLLRVRVGVRVRVRARVRVRVRVQDDHTIMMDLSEQVSAIAMQMSPGACNLVSQW